MSAWRLYEVQFAWNKEMRCELVVAADLEKKYQAYVSEPISRFWSTFGRVRNIGEPIPQSRACFCFQDAGS